MFGALQDDLMLQKQWFINGQNYSRTLDAWLHRLDTEHQAIKSMLQVP